MIIHLADGTRLCVSEHACERYHERVCPTLDPVQAGQHLVRLAAQVGELAQFPDWVWLEDRDNSRCATLGPDIVLVIRGRGLVVTCVARGGLTPALAHRRTSRRRRRRARARHPGPSRIVRAQARSKRREQRAPGLDEAA